MTKKIKVQKEINNIVVISRKDLEKMNYVWSIIIRTQPRIYRKFECIELNVLDDLIPIADYIIKLLYYCGLEEVSRENTSIKTDKGYTIKNAWRIILKKNPNIDYLK